ARRDGARDRRRDGRLRRRRSPRRAEQPAALHSRGVRRHSARCPRRGWALRLRSSPARGRDALAALLLHAPRGGARALRGAGDARRRSRHGRPHRDGALGGASPPRARDRPTRGPRRDPLRVASRPSRRRPDATPLTAVHGFVYSAPGPMADQVDGGSNEAREARLRERELLSEASAVLSSSLDVNETVSELVRLLVPRLVDWASVRIAKEDGTPELVALAHAVPERLARGRELEARLPASPSEQSAVNEVLHTGRSIFLPRISEEMLVESARSPEYLEHTLALGMISAMFVALKARGRTFGALVLCTDASSGRALDEDDLALMEEIAARAALAIDNARLF